MLISFTLNVIFVIKDLHKNNAKITINIFYLYVFSIYIEEVNLKKKIIFFVIFCYIFYFII